MTDTPETDAEHQTMPMGGFTLDFARKLERKRNEARETVESLTTTSFDLLASLEKARDERDSLAEALEYILGIGLTQKTKAKAKKALEYLTQTK